MTSTANDQLLNLDAIELVECMVDEMQEIRKWSFVSYSHPPPLQSRYNPNAAETLAIARALDLRGELGLPFWDSVLLSLFGEDGVDARGLLVEAQRHQELRGKEFWLTAEELRSGALRSVVAGAGEHVGICSEVLLSSGHVRHVPLLDFHCPSPSNLGLVRQVCERILTKRVAILQSGESFHAYGLCLLTAEDLTELLHRALLFSPIVDRAYVAHQLIEKRCVLRVTNSSEKPLVPRVVQVTC
ncbi:hypothetical protein DTL21_28255 [Bremerella cremea]|uniref:Uncharacterized protein n=1 Tax=Blastopirellula marina TaxID=124 RepID=A0A2S8F8K5_9BACT|nr:hypothetical protein C5Y83_28205 [Blastopirellula marina]RCS41866.1 hypothetical protein DTL21_28255 [Bremerella cremea]